MHYATTQHSREGSRVETEADQWFPEPRKWEKLAMMNDGGGTWLNIFSSFINIYNCQALMAHSCNPSYLGG
jgi:hypothetical protein